MAGASAQRVAAREGDNQLVVESVSKQVRRRDGRPGRLARRAARQHPVHHRPQRRRQDVAAEHDLGLLQARQRPHPARRPRHHPEEAERHRRARHRAHLPEHRPVQRPDRARQPDAGPPRAHEGGRAGERHLLGHGAEGRHRPSRGDRGDHRVPEAPGPAQAADGGARLRPAQAGRARPRAGARAQGAAARRADGRHEPGREGRHGALHPGREPGARHHGRADRARHGRGHGHLRPAWSCSTAAGASPPARPRRSSAIPR